MAGTPSIPEGYILIPADLHERLLTSAEVRARFEGELAEGRQAQQQTLEIVKDLRRRVIEGNGEPSVMERLRRLEASDTLKGKVLPALIGASGVVLVGLIGAAAKYAVGG